MSIRGGKKSSIPYLIPKIFLLAALCNVLNVSILRAQDSTGRWFVGLSGGMALGQCTFRSVTQDKKNFGGSAGIFGGYSFNSVFALEGAASLGSMKLSAQSCDPYWLSDNDQTYFAPVIDQTGDFYRNITAKNKFSKFALQLDIDILKIFTEPCNKFSIVVAPQISIVNTKNKLSSDILDHKYASQTHFGYGAQAAIGCFVSKRIDIQIFCGLTALTGDRIDNLPKHHHESNHLWDGGIKIAYRFGRTCGDTPAPPYTDNNQNPPSVDIVETTDTTQNQPVEVVVEDNNNDNTNINDDTNIDTNNNDPNATPRDNEPQVVEPQKMASLQTIYFYDNGVLVPQKEYAKIREAARYLTDNPGARFSIYGYCSKSGTDEYNLYLSKRRCETIKKRLIQLGVSEDRIVKTEGRGIDHAAPDSKTARRVEIVIEK